MKGEGFAPPGNRYRCAGIAKALLVASLHKHRELGRTHVSAAVSGSNEAGIALLRSPASNGNGKRIHLFEYGL